MFILQVTTFPLNTPIRRKGKKKKQTSLSVEVANFHLFITGTSVSFVLNIINVSSIPFSVFARVQNISLANLHLLVLVAARLTVGVNVDILGMVPEKLLENSLSLFKIIIRKKEKNANFTLILHMCFLVFLCANFIS